jgi:antitoxin ParD1/3/4
VVTRHDQARFVVARSIVLQRRLLPDRPARRAVGLGGEHQLLGCRDRRVGKVCHRDRLLRMPTRNISLTREQDAFVDEMVDSGDYQNASEAIRDALRVLQQRRREDKLKLQALRAQLKLGVDALRRGDFDEVDEADLHGYLTSLTGSGRKPGHRAR